MNESHERFRRFLRILRVKNALGGSTTGIGGGNLIWQDSRSGEDNPAHVSQIKAHLNATTVFNGSRFKIEGATSGFASTRFTDSANPNQKTNIISMSGDMLDVGDLSVLNVFVNPSLRSSTVNEALSSFYNNARSALTSFQGGTFVGEIGETLTLLKRPAKSIRNLIDAYHKDAKKRTRRFVRASRNSRSASRIDPVYISDANKVLSDTWLEYSFGLRPLLSDVRDGASALARLALHPYEFQRVRGYAEHFEPTNLFGSGSYLKILDSWIQFQVTNRQKTGYQCRYLGEVKCEVQTPYLMAKEVLGFDPSSFLPTVYNLIPYSFLVDYFSNLGDVINAWSFPQSKLSWYCRTLRSCAERETLAAFIPSRSSGTITVESSSGPTLQVKSSRNVVERTGTVAGLGLPSLTFSVPGANLKWLNIAALAHMRTL